MRAVAPYLLDGKLQALEISVDATWGTSQTEPDWFQGLLNEWQGPLVAHAIGYSINSSRWIPSQEEWLKQFRSVMRQSRFRWATAHFGLAATPTWPRMAPLPVDFGSVQLEIARDRFLRFAEAAQVPVGLENLALAFKKEHVQKQGEFLEKILSSCDGFLLLDLHNLYCQSVNFNVDIDSLLDAYPLHLVREIHVSGGSWSKHCAEGKLFRRDTHDGSVPDECFAALDRNWTRFPNLQMVTIERMPGSVANKAQSRELINEVECLRSLLLKFPAQSTLPDKTNFFPPAHLNAPVESLELGAEEDELMTALEDESGATSILTVEGKQSSGWEPAPIEVAAELLRKWGRRV